MFKIASRPGLRLLFIGLSLVSSLLTIFFNNQEQTVRASARSSPSYFSPMRTVRGKISVINSKQNDPSNIVVWLEPLSGKKRKNNTDNLVLRQKNKQFSQRVLIANVGQKVDFPNDDPFNHNIFSNSAVKRFDLGLFQEGESRTVMFTNPGVIPVYCNIHPRMKAFIVVVNSPYYGLTNEQGEIRIKNVPRGRYRLRVWHERADEKDLESLTREVRVSRKGSNLGIIEIDESSYVETPHKNKEGKDYPKPKS